MPNTRQGTAATRADPSPPPPAAGPAAPAGPAGPAGHAGPAAPAGPSKVPQPAAVSKVRVLTVEALKEQMQLATESQLPQLAAQTSQQVAQQSVLQLMNAVVQERSQELLAASLRVAMDRAASSVKADVEQALRQAVRTLLDPNTEPVTRAVILKAADDKRRPALDQVDTMGRGRTLQALQLCMAEAMQTAMLDSYREAVTVMSHFALHDAVSAVLQARLPAVIQDATNGFRESLHRLLREDALRPVVQQLTHEAAQHNAEAASKNALYLALKDSLPVPSAAQHSPLTPPLTPAPPNPPPPVSAALLQSFTYPHILPPPKSTAANPSPVPAGAPAITVAPTTVTTPSPAPATTPSSAAAPATTPSAAPAPSSSPALAPSPLPTPAPSADGPAEPRRKICRTGMVLPDPDTGLWEYVNLSLPVESFSSEPAAKVEASVPVRHIDALPDNVLLRILGHLDPLARVVVASKVCQRWQQLALHETLWKDETLRYEPRNKNRFSQLLLAAPLLGLVDCEKMSRPMIRGRTKPPAVPAAATAALLHTRCRVRGLKLVTADLQPSFVMEVLRKHAANLERLDLMADDALCQYGQQNQSELFSTIDGLPALRRLRLAGIYNYVHTFSPRAAGSPSRLLTELDLEYYEAASPSTASSLIKANSAVLRAVRLSSAVSSEELMNLSLCSHLMKMTIPCEAMRNFVPKFPSLVKLTLKQTRPVNALGPPVRYPGALLMPFLDALELHAVVEVAAIPECVRVAFPQIKTVTFRRTHLVKDFLPLIRQMPSLQRLCFDEEYQITADVFLGLRHVAPQLKEIKVLRSVRCAGASCWQPITKYFHFYWPDATVYVDLPCSCRRESE